jgi:hypothetical protein
MVMALIVSSFPSTIFAAQAKIQGDYCYQYGDSESLMAAKEISYAMALRKAIETYKTFVASTSVVQDFKLRKDLVETIASGYVENVKIIKQDVQGRNVCTELVGYVNPDAVKSIIARKVEKTHKTKKKEFEGLLSNKLVKIINYKKSYCDVPITSINEPCVKILYQAKMHIVSNVTTIIVDCYDKDGNQLQGNKRMIPYSELYEGEVRETFIIIPSDTVSFELRLR